jgi:hypothetical protein
MSSERGVGDKAVSSAAPLTGELERRAPSKRELCPRCNKRYLTRGFKICSLCEHKERMSMWICKTPPCKGSYIRVIPEEHYAAISHEFPSTAEVEAYQDIHDHTTEDRYRDWERYL